MDVLRYLWRNFRGDKKYREAFVEAQLKQGIPLQIRSIMKRRKLSQEQLAKQAGLTQGAISRAANPNYGNLTLNTIIRVAAGFDMAFVGKFVPFGELADWYSRLPENDWDIPTFDEEDASLSSHSTSPIDIANNP